MNKAWLLLVGAAMGLSSCVVTGNVEVFSAFNLRASKTPCVQTGNVRELNLAFTYTGELRGVNMTFTPNGKPAQTVNISNLRSPPVGFRIDTLTAGDAKLYVNLEQINPTTTGITQPDPVTLRPMDIAVDAFGTSQNAKISLAPLSNVDVSACYAPTPPTIN
jgi:hypothetical protein